ncbi:unnamed protein product [Meloidogyne enterolobii]|uniref:Uncharacterized protein n=1 Tax=Meloidogyne enterolobii TaxID=390850 RepID=A0ACB0YTW4_MELEN
MEQPIAVPGGNENDNYRENNEPFCSLCCNPGHKPSQCSTYSTPQQREVRLLEQGRCLKCLQQNHTTEQCQRLSNCRKCGSGQHHFLICAPPPNPIDYSTTQVCYPAPRLDVQSFGVQSSTLPPTSNSNVSQRQTSPRRNEEPNPDGTVGNATMFNSQRDTTAMCSLHESMVSVKEVKEETAPVMETQDTMEPEAVKEESKPTLDSSTYDDKEKLISKHIEVSCKVIRSECVLTIVRLVSRSQISYTVKEPVVQEKPSKASQEVLDNIPLQKEELTDCVQPSKQPEDIRIHTLAKCNEVTTSEMTIKNDNDNTSVNPDRSSKESSQPILQNPTTLPPIKIQLNRKNVKWKTCHDSITDQYHPSGKDNIDNAKIDKTIFELDPSTNPGWFCLILILRVVIGIIQCLRPRQLHVFKTSKAYIKQPMHDSYSKQDDKTVCIWSIRHDQYSLLENCATYPTNNVDTSHHALISSDGLLYLKPRANFCNGPETIMKCHHSGRYGIWMIGKTSTGFWNQNSNRQNQPNLVYVYITRIYVWM